MTTKKQKWWDTPCSCATASNDLQADTMKAHGGGCLRLMALKVEEQFRKQEERLDEARKKRAEAVLAPPPGPRVVCTQCPAVAKVHYYKVGSGSSGGAETYAEIWVECHGVHVFGSSFESRKRDDDLLFHKITKHEPATIAMEVSRATTRLAETSNEMLVRLRYLEAAGKLSPSRLDELFQLAERNMLFWQEQVTSLQAKMKS